MWWKVGLGLLAFFPFSVLLGVLVGRRFKSMREADERRERLGLGRPPL